MLLLFKLTTQYSKQYYSITADLTSDFTLINVKFDIYGSVYSTKFYYFVLIPFLNSAAA